MKCEKCKGNKPSHTTTVYYGRISGQSTANYKQTSTTTKSVTEIRYNKVESKVITLCDECIYKDNIAMILAVPLGIIFLPIFFLIGIIAGNLSADEIAIVAYIIFLGPFIVSAVIASILIAKKSYKKIKKQDIFRVARNHLKKRHKKIDPNGRYSYWDSYPKNLHQIRY